MAKKQLRRTEIEDLLEAGEEYLLRLVQLLRPNGETEADEHDRILARYKLVEAIDTCRKAGL